MSGNAPVLRWLLRAAAILIAIFGAIDPALTSERTSPVTISLIDTASATTAAGAADRLAATLAPHHTIVRGPSADAALTLVVGDALPSRAGAITGPALVAVPAADAGVAITRVQAPARASFESRVPVRVEVRAMKDRAAHVVVALHVSGAIVDRVERDLPAGTPAVVDLSFVPLARGVATARVSATIAGSEPRAFADLAVDVTDRTWSILVFDRRASWMSTFVRRALEADARFSVTSRTNTSTNVAAASTDAPATLGVNARLDRFDAIVVGAPDALSREDADGLEAFARRHGGAVIALMDRADPGPLGAIAGVPRWTDAQTPAPVEIATTRAMTPAMRASEFAVPAAMPAAADVTAAFGAGNARRAVMLETPLGAGRLLISGLLDGWRYRGSPDASPFEAFWREAIGRAADATPLPLDAVLDRPIAAPGDETTLDVTLRDAALAPITASGVESQVAAQVRAEKSDAAPAPVRLWPTGPGRFQATLRSPAKSGVYRVTVTDGTHTVNAPLVVLDDARRSTPDDRAMLQAWASARGGPTLDAPDPPAVLAAIDALAHPARRAERWHPMRSGWWVLPFSVLLGAEWWLRRRKDLA